MHTCNYPSLKVSGSVVSCCAAGLCALLLVLGAALGLGGLPRHLLLDHLALLPGHRGALAGGGSLALLLVHVLGDGGGHVAAELLGHVIANLARGGNIVADLNKEYWS